MQNALLANRKASGDPSNDSSNEPGRAAIRAFADIDWNNEARAQELLIQGNSFRRPTRAKDLPFLKLDQPLPLAQLASNAALVLHRLLFNAYEMDLLFLPSADTPAAWQAFDSFYAAGAAGRADLARPLLEELVFGALTTEIDIAGKWTGDLLRAYFEDFLAKERAAADLPVTEDPALAGILAADNPQEAAQHYLVQLAPDFLSEASAMARLAPGAYGPLQSALFNVLIDEYGAAVHRAKHSTLFEATLLSRGLDPHPHCYWQFYQPSALLLTNYFHFVTRNKAHFFRYLGALFYTESTLVNTAGRQSALLRQVFGDAVDTRYFDEHHHIDRHHSQMVLTRLIEPAIATYGSRATVDILRGFEELRLLQKLADQDLVEQLHWAGHITVNDAKLAPLLTGWRAAPDATPSETFVECQDERSTTHIHADDRLLVLETGAMDFFPMAGVTLSLAAGDHLFIPGGRLHGSIVRSESCTYHQPILNPAQADPLWRPSVREM